jgi:hypothetical protein
VFRLTLRVLLVLLYALTLYLLTRVCVPPEWFGAPWQTVAWKAVLVFLGLQSSAAIYAISNGQAEIVAAFFVVAHFYCYERKRYLAAAAMICIGVYFKLWPILFMWPYVLFSLFSRAHRRYLVCVAAVGLVVACAALPVAGWRFGFFYPVAMIYDVVTTGTLVPMGSREVFGLVFFISRLSSGFAVDAADVQNLARTQTITMIASLLLILSTSASALVLARFEKTWNRGAANRRAALLMFQSVIGFLAVSFSVDVSITHFLYVMVSLYWPIWLLAAPPPEGTWRIRRALLVAVPYCVGIVLIGNLIPLSLLFRVLPLGWIDSLTVNASAPLVPHEQYIWYQIPLAGVYLIALSMCIAFLITRKTSSRQAALEA